MPKGAPTHQPPTARHDQHARIKEDRRRGTPTQRGYTSQWARASKQFLREHPLCQCPACDEGRRRVRAASVVDHRIPHRGDGQLFWDTSNWQALHKRCHDRKTAREVNARRHTAHERN